MRVNNSDLGDNPSENSGILPCSAIPQSPTPFLIVSFIAPIGSSSKAILCGGVRRSKRLRRNTPYDSLIVPPHPRSLPRAPLRRYGGALRVARGASRGCRGTIATPALPLTRPGNPGHNTPSQPPSAPGRRSGVYRTLPERDHDHRIP
jgi:hypothetical protein